MMLTSCRAICLPPPTSQSSFLPLLFFPIFSPSLSFILSPLSFISCILFLLSFPILYSLPSLLPNLLFSPFSPSYLLFYSISPSQSCILSLLSFPILFYLPYLLSNIVFSPFSSSKSSTLPNLFSRHHPVPFLYLLHLSPFSP